MSNKAVNGRVEAIDFAKGIAIIAVTLGHILGSYKLKDSIIFQYVYSFELPLFFIVSGYLAQLKENINLSNLMYVRKQIRTVLYPYVMFCLATALFNAALSIRYGLTSAVIHFLKDVGYIVSMMGLGALWFLPTFFFATVIAFAIYKKIINADDRKNSILIVITGIVVLVGSILSYVTEELSFMQELNYEEHVMWKTFAWYIMSLISRSMVGVSLILLGRIIAMLYKKCAIYNIGVICKRFAAFLFLVTGFYMNNMQSNYVDLHFSFIRNPFLFYTSAVLTTIGLLLIGANIKVINWFGKNSLIIMFCQIIQQHWCSLTNKVFFIDSCQNISYRYLASFASLIIILLLSTVVVWAIHKNSFLKLLIEPKIRRKGKIC